jgi:hypothetical protein
VLGIVLGLATFSSTSSADQHGGATTEHGKWIEAVKATGVFFSARYRFEHVDDKGFTKNANAHTIQTHLGYKSDIHYGVSGLIELENVEAIGSGDYNSTTNGRTNFPTVADPENSEINRVHLSYHNIPDTVVTVGRQRLVLDNARFVGDVGFRQNQQTFDALTVANSSLPDLGLAYVYVKQILRIFGDDNALGTLNSNSHVLHAAYSGLDFANIVGYGYFLDVDDDVPTLSSGTLGLRASGKRALGDSLTLLYTGEYAHQTDYASNPNSYGLNYYLIEPGIKYEGLTLKFDYEVLEGNSTAAFQTPLATLHKFQGWADKFLTTPADGIEDAYVTAKYGFGEIGFLDSLTALAVYHDFSAEDSSRDLGNEINVGVFSSFHKHFKLSLEYADFDAEDFSTDSEKIWLTFGVKL